MCYGLLLLEQELTGKQIKVVNTEFSVSCRVVVEKKIR